MQIHECVSFVVLKDQQVLLEKRAQDKEYDPNLIAIPGGHMEHGETREQTLFRELKEELNIVPTNYLYLCSLYHPTGELQLIHYYVINDWEGTIVSLEADEVSWFPLHTNPLDIAADKIALSEYLRLRSVLE
ncbi:NUDIX domain-containing protein [Marinomonas hwangdonensis]|uniref:8-oxo-dGTP diphosphatase n=1 Tax=Marinomonas hwangdonensis TaxID=1053647 RepID=A0A3M8QCK3_9GAMM|nr:NUDIX domain-containing protein [Marinomonas hwangdonensis]RNF52814.1 NUDIX domain-containing protein [Marinomonas hwangdonensis]